MTGNVRDLFLGERRRPAVSITLHRATGPSGEVERTFDGDNPWEDANAQLLFWALTAPRGGGKDPVDFIVRYGDGMHHRGSLDLTIDGADLPTHIHRHLARLVDNRHIFDRHIAVDRLIEFRDRYEIGRAPAPNPQGED